MPKPTLYDAAMRTRRRFANDRPRSRLPLGVNIALTLAVAVVAALGIGALLWLLLGRPPIHQARGWTTANSFEFAKIVLALIGGVGAVVALVIAYRKQHLGEAAEQREDLKLFAERFTKASDQLGSDKAPVRLAGLHALEDLAQGTPSQRQTIVNVLCAYLRMPYMSPIPLGSISDGLCEPATLLSADGSIHAVSSRRVEKAENERRLQEQQVRQTACRILSAHLRPGGTLAQPVDTFWKDIDLDLTGATLHDVDFSKCHLRTAQFGGTKFDGSTRFSLTTFSADAWFGDATFGGYTSFGGATFGEDARFDGARFSGDVWFGGDLISGAAKFCRAAWFHDAEFRGKAYFSSVKFVGSAHFDRAKFVGDASFSEAKFGESAWLGKANFGGTARFSNVKFEGSLFCDTTFDGDALFDLAEFGEHALFRSAKFGRNAFFGGAKFGGITSFDSATFDGKSSFIEVRVRIDGVEHPGERLSWPEGLAVVDPRTENDARLPDQGGRWGYLDPVASSNNKSGESQK